MTTGVTRIIERIRQGDDGAWEELWSRVYDELRRMAAAQVANEHRDASINATVLVHEAYLRLTDGQQPTNWSGRSHFFCAAAEAMRRILIERARKRAAAKRGGGRSAVPLSHLEVADETPDEDLEKVDEAIERLGAIAPDKAQLVKLRFYAGLTIADAAEVLDISPATAKRYWTFARAWLFDAISSQSSEPSR